MLMFPPQRQYHHNLRSTDGLIILANWLETGAILVHYQPSYKNSHTMKPSDPLLLTDVALSWGMCPAGKFDTFGHPGISQIDHAIGEPSADTGS